MGEKERLKMEENKANELYNSKAVEMDQRAIELSYADAETRKAIDIAMKDYNSAMVSCNVYNYYNNKFIIIAYFFVIVLFYLINIFLFSPGQGEIFPKATRNNPRTGR